MSIIKQHRYLLFLLLVVLIVCITNYAPGTWLTGWDNLHVEFNLPMNIYRSFFAVWQEYQGLGLLGGMAHASDLPRQLFLLLFSFVIPVSFLRYFYMFVMLFVGVAGIYKLVKDVFFTGERGAFLAALFYLFNLGTIQYFFVPFEPYSTFWGFFPWEIYVAIRYLEHPSRKNLFLLAVVNIFAIPQAYVQTVFLVYSICLVSLLVNYLLTHRSKLALWICAKVLLVVFSVNAFWLLPNLYFVVNDVNVTQNSIHNKMDTDKFFQMNKARGTLSNFARLAQFNYDLLDTNRITQKTTFLLQPWRDHLETPFAMLLGYSFFALVVFGLFVKHPNRYFLVTLFALSCIVFLSDTPLFTQANELLRNAPLVNQIFRNPFSKFIVPTVFVFSLLFGLAVTKLLLFLENERQTKKPLVVFTLIGALLFWYGLPVFQSNFFSSQVRVPIPKHYFNLFSYFKTQDKNARIMNLPQGNYWGWGSYSWGVTGSGFLWYGIEQPILDRAFDVWSKQLEGYYWELWYALKKKDQRLFNQVIDKYHVSYIIYDPSYAPSDSNPFKILYNQQDMLTKNDQVTLVKKFGSILVYKTNRLQVFNNNLSLGKNLPMVYEHEPFSNEDTLFTKLGYYRQAKTLKNVFIAPFGSLFTNRFQNENTFSVSAKQDNIVFSRTLPKGTYQLTYPSLITTEAMIPVDIFAKRTVNNLDFRFSVVQPEIRLNETILTNDTITEEVSLRLIGQPASASFVLSINNQEFFPVASTKEYTFIGNTYFFNAQGANNLRLYATQNAQTINLSLPKFAINTECEPQKKKTLINTNVVTDTFVLQAKNVSVCSRFQDAIPFEEKQLLLQVSFDYTSTSDEFPDYCFATAESHSCINSKKHYASHNGFSNTERAFSDFVEITSSISDPNFQLILDATSDHDSNQLKQITYRNVRLTKYPYLVSISGDIGLTQKFLPNKTQRITLPKESTITVTMPKRMNSFDFPDLLDDNVYKKTALTATGLPVSGEYHLQELKEGKDKGIRVYAKNTYSQLWFTLLESEANFGYLLGLKTRNITGFPFVINAFTPSENNKYVYTQLPKNTGYQQTYFVLPPFYEFDKGLQILLMSSSFNRLPSVNDITDVSLFPIPYTFLTNIVFSPLSDLPAPELEMPAEATKDSLSMYRLTFPDAKTADTVILSQSFHKGWKAYQVQSFLATAFPFIFGTELKEHVLVNNWQNGWVLNDSTIQQYNNATIIILFLPQYLEYIGLIVGALALIIFTIRLPLQEIRQELTKQYMAGKMAHAFILLPFI